MDNVKRYYYSTYVLPTVSCVLIVRHLLFNQKCSADLHDVEAKAGISQAKKRKG